MKDKSFFKKHREIIMYLIFCVVCALSNWLVYIAMVKALKVDLSVVGNSDNALFSVFSGESGDNLTRLLICTFTAWVVNVIVAFVTNKIWVFKSKEKSFKGVLKEFLTFLSGHLFTGVLDWLGTPLLVMLGLNQSILGIEGALAKLIISIAVMVLNFVISKLIVFKNKNK